MNIIEIAEKIKKNGGKLYLVGGALRDELLNKKEFDKDYCVTGISKQKFKELFPESKIIGKNFEVFLIDNTEFALARKEKKTGIGHKQFAIEAKENITIQEDLKRRDITINAMAKDVLTGEIIDPYGGIGDIKNKIIKATTKAFKEDPLRAYRVARIAAQTQFEVQEETIELMYTLKEEIKTLSKDRIYRELKKALESKKPSIFFEVLRKAKILEVHFKEIYNLIGSIQPIKYHPEGDSYNHTMIVVDKASTLTKDVKIIFSALVHDIGKGITPKQMYPHHYGHDEKGVMLVEQMGKRIGVPNTWIKCGKTAAKEHMKAGIFFKMTTNKKVQFIERVNKTLLVLEGLQTVVIADKCSSRNIKIEEIQFDKIGKQCIEIINGNYIKQIYNIKNPLEIKNKLHQERIKWIEQLE